jgi:hypothetical protein
MIYGLWHLKGGSLIGTWESEAEALAEVREAIRTVGTVEVEAWALFGEPDDPDADIIAIADGTALVERARTAEPAAAG